MKFSLIIKTLISEIKFKAPKGISPSFSSQYPVPVHLGTDHLYEVLMHDQ